MIKTLLVASPAGEFDDSTADAAFEIAQAFKAHMEFLYLRLDPACMLVATGAAGVAGAGGVVTGTLHPTQLAEFEAYEELHANRARQKFDAFCVRRSIPVAEKAPGPGGVSAAWRELVTDGTLPVREAWHCDLLVLPGGSEEEDLRPKGIGAIVMGCGRPALLVPRRVSANLRSTIVVAWKGTAEAARAVTAAMPLLYKASSIVVLSVEEGKDKSMTSPDRVVEQLRWHGLPAEGRRIRCEGRSGPDALVAAASSIKADLLVMGAYGRPRLLELILGGYTEHMINAVPFPILMFY
jgi:nucleotide-binding universal stress UspA family protein